MSLLIKARENWLQYSTSLLFAVCIITLPAYTSVGKMAFNLLALLSLFYLARNFHELKSLDSLLKIFFIVIVVGFLWTLFTFYINGSPGRGKNFIWSRQSFLLFLPALYLLFRAVKIPFFIIWLSVVLSVTLAAYVGYQDTLTGWGRAQGGMHPILFGSILLCEAFFLLMVAMVKKHLWLNIVSLLGFFVASIVVVWTQSRGVWVAYPVLLLFLVFVLLKKYSVVTKVMAIIGFLIMISLLILHPVVQERIQMTEDSIERYMVETDINDLSKQTSLGARLEMWKAGWQIFLENPLTGVGIGGYDVAAKEASQRYGISSSAYWFYHPHNQYISALSTRGFPGFLLVLSVLIIPALFKIKKSNKSTGYQLDAILIYVVCCAYGVFGLSDVPLEGKASIVFYVVIIALFLLPIEEDDSRSRIGTA